MMLFLLTFTNLFHCHVFYFCRLKGNPVCDVDPLLKENDCQLELQAPGPNSTDFINCLCPTGQKSNPQSQSCECQYPFEGFLYFRGPLIRELSNRTLFQLLQQNLAEKLQLPSASVSIQAPLFNSDDYLKMQVDLFPPSGKCFNRSEILRIASTLSHQTFDLSKVLGSFYFSLNPYNFSGKLNDHFKIRMLLSSHDLALAIMN